MPDVEHPAWVEAAAAAAVRLAAEAGADVDDLLEHGAAPGVLGFNVTRLQQSAELDEVAADLAGLLWAECADVPPIATILEEPAARAALEAVAEARRQAAARLAGRDEPAAAGSRGTAEPAGPGGTAEPAGSRGTIEPAGPGGTAEPTLPVKLIVTLPPLTAPSAPLPSTTVAVVEAPRRRPRGTVVAGAAATAIVLFGRRLRRA